MEERARGPNITNDDRLSFVESMLSDEVKIIHRSSQDLLYHSAFDLHNIILRVVDFYDKVTEVFNGNKFVLETEILLDLYSDFAKSKKK